MTEGFYENFSRALMNPERSAEPFPARRLTIYRNNVAVSLIGAMRAQFPAVARLVGDELFSKLALAYVRATPPRSVLLFEIGEDFHVFLRNAEVLARHPFIAEVAQLEYLMARAQHAADKPAIDASSLKSFAEDELADLVFVWHPAAHLFRSRHSAVTICGQNRDGGEPCPIADLKEETAIVTRPQLAVDVRLLPAGGHAFLSAIQSGECLQAAAERGFQDSGAFDLAANIAGMFASGAIAGVRPMPKPQETT